MSAQPQLRDDIARYHSALCYLDPDMLRVDWFMAACGFKDAGGSLEDFDNWSSEGKSYKGKADVQQMWTSIKPGGYTSASLIAMAKRAGWKDKAVFHTPTRAEIDARAAAQAARAEQSAKDASSEHAKAALWAQNQWDAAKPVGGDGHPYLDRKAVKSHGLRVGRFEGLDRTTGEIITLYKNALLIPIRDRKRKIWSLQAIPESVDGKKLYLKGSAKSGHFYALGVKPLTRSDGRKVFVLGEGYATCASVHEATGHMTLVCFDTSDLMPVAMQLRERIPDAVLIFAADNDEGVVGNPGVTSAQNAARAVDGLVVVPPPGDFNDLHVQKGVDAVRQLINDIAERPVTVILAPDRQSATGAAYALRALRPGEELPGDCSAINTRGPSEIVVQVYSDDLVQRATELSERYPRANVFVLARPGEERAAIELEKTSGVCVETLGGFGAGQFESWFDAMMSSVDGRADADAGAREQAEGTLERVAQAASACTRDEERRRQQQDENKRIQEVEAGAMVPSLISVEDMVERCIYIAEGKNVAYVTEDRSLFLKFDEFRSLTAAAKTEIDGAQSGKSAKKSVPNASIWQSDPRRVDAMTATFHPGKQIITANPNGLRAVNTWRPIKRWTAKADVGPFLEQVDYLFPDLPEREVFLDWLAHIEQKPGELPHYGWLHIAENTGTGRNWTASVLARVFRGYVAPNVDLPGLLDSAFNCELGGRVLAIVDEVQEGASEGNCRHAERLKSMINAEMRTVNNKYGLKYTEFNACRWLVFSNHKNALPLNEEDRRFRVVMHPALPRSPEVYKRLYAALANPEFINAVGVFLSKRDISNFKPGERPPLNEAKRAAVAASKPMSTQNAEEIVACWPADLIIYKHTASLLTGDPDKREFPAALRRAMEEAGAVTWQQGARLKIKIASSSHRVWVLRNTAKWLAAGTDAIRKEIMRAGVDDLTPASAVLADSAEKLERLREPPI